MSLRHKLSVLSVGVVVAMSLATALLAHFILSERIEGWWDNRFRDFTEGQILSISHFLAEDNLVVLDAYIWDLKLREGLYVAAITVESAAGETLARAESDGPSRPEDVTAEYRAPLAWDEEPIGTVAISFYRTPVSSARDEMSRLLLSIAVIGSGIAALLATRLADRLLAPLSRLASEVAGLDVDSQQSLTRSASHDEIGEISNALADAYEKLRRSGDRNRAMVEELREVTGKLQEELEINAGLRARLEEENRQLQAKVRQREPGGPAIGESGDLAPAIDKVRNAANSKLTVLLSGESGTGKEVLAGLLHQWSDRSERRLVVVNCAALPENLIESELFGHVKGAFTGASESKAGKFMLADSGTLFLDEIGELPLAMQPKLLRVLEAGEIDRVGADRPVPVDVRVVAATNRNLEDEVAAGRFRSDLYYRLKVIHIEIPPLRERPNDLKALAERFLEEIASDMRIAAPVLSPGALELLRAYPWPGNVRELRHILAATLSQHPVVVLDADHFASVLPQRVMSRVAQAGRAGASPLQPSETLDGFLEMHERRVLEAELRLRSTQKDIAQRLQLSEARLHRLLKKHGLLRKGRSPA